MTILFQKVAVTYNLIWSHCFCNIHINVTRWFSPCTPASSSTKTGRQDIAEMLLKVASNTINQIKLLM